MTLHEEIFGRIRHKGEIENAALATLKKWLSLYLRVVREQHEFVELAEARTFAVVSEFERFPEENLPAIITMTGPATAVERTGDGYYKATYPLSAAFVTAAASPRVARDAAHLFAGAGAAVLLQKLSREYPDLVIRWVGDESQTVSLTKSRTIVAVEHSFEVQMTHIVSDLLGTSLDEPPEEIPTDLPEVVDTAVDVTHVVDES